jgi:hypothetical protein
MKLCQHFLLLAARWFLPFMRGQSISIPASTESSHRLLRPFDHERGASCSCARGHCIRLASPYAADHFMTVGILRPTRCTIGA